MDKEDIIRMAREAGFEIDCCSLEWHERIERFAAMVAAYEREECAKFCEEQYMFYGYDHVFADGIRARGEK